jgi:hypothetical protein
MIFVQGRNKVVQQISISFTLSYYVISWTAKVNLSCFVGYETLFDSPQIARALLQNPSIISRIFSRNSKEVDSQTMRNFVINIANLMQQ